MSQAKPLNVAAIAEKWKHVDGSLIMMLHSIQNECGYVPRQAAMELSQLTDIPLAKVYEVLTFYHFFKLTPPAKYQVSVCTGTACYLKGAPDLLKELEKQTGAKEGKLSDDGQFSLTALRCIGCCGLAPVISVNGKIHGQLKPADIKGIIDAVKEGK